jgi:hypothetical protein
VTSPLHDAIDRMLREQTDQTNMIETLWLLYAAHVKVPPGGTQWIECRRAFFGGATTLFEAIMRIMEPGSEPTDADCARMDQIARELQRYGADLKAGAA